MEYSETSALVAALYITEINSRVKQHGTSFAQQYNLLKGLSKFGPKGEEAAMKELEQLNARNCFEPISVANLTQPERDKTVDAMMLLTEKKSGAVKGRMVYNGKPTRIGEYFSDISD